MTLSERIEAFSILGDKIRAISNDSMEEYARRAQLHNQWFTEENLSRAFEGIAFMLEKDKLQQWLEPYEPLSPEVPKITGIIMAGNIPMVGFHDLLSVLITGHFAAIKTSSQDTYLVQLLIDWLLEIEPRFKKNLEVRDRLTAIDALIATGSDNTARYFEYYFRNHPRVIRKNRTSVAILDGSETETQLKALGKDIFWYFGLGCRNVSKVFVPKNYDPKAFFEANEELNYLADHNKYRNNYDYHKSILLVNGVKHLDNGFLLWQPSEELVSPISVLYVEEYEGNEALKAKLEANADKLQCIVGNGHTPFGQAQTPEVWDYADGVDTVAFLKGL
ncbi:MAG: acyl-CoA reductase [Marinoscillum sp.]|uniref:acyl-CoA reductase n=1 Tax=Marinoscillum sp. TaxID=2024838 RepID=UPI0032FE801C